MINDNIEGGKNSNNVINYATRYNLAFTGDGVLNEDGLTDQYVAINNDIINAGEKLRLKAPPSASVLISTKTRPPKTGTDTDVSWQH